MNRNGEHVQLVGVTVTISYLSDPLIGHGQFRLDNPGDEVWAALEKAWLELGERRQELSAISLFDIRRDEPLDPGGFPVPKASTVDFLLGFPQVAYQPRAGESVAVGVVLRVSGQPLNARSYLELVRRIPYQL